MIERLACDDMPALFLMCQVFDEHWGFAREDFNYKSPADMIRDLVICRRYGANFLMNVGPMEDGTLRMMDAAICNLIGQWVAIHREAIYDSYPSGIEIDNKQHDFILQKDNTYYLFAITYQCQVTRMFP